MLIPIATIGLVIFVQVIFWFPSSPKSPAAEGAESDNKSAVEQREMEESLNNHKNNNDVASNSTTDTNSVPETNKAEETATVEDSDLFQKSNNNWRCACEGGFLPPGMLKTFGSAEAMMRLGTGQCYHKQT